MKRVLLTISILILAAGAYAQRNDNFELKGSVIDAGGRDQETLSPNFNLPQSSLGQTAIGYSTSANFTLYGGYLAAPPPQRVPGGILMDVTGLVTDLTEIGVSVDDITAEINGQEFAAKDVPVIEGPAAIHVFAKDQFDQSTALNVNFTLDITPPIRPTLDSVITPAYVSPQIITGTKEANTSLWMFKDGQETEVVPLDAQTTWAYALDLNEGENPFQIYAKDQAGNESTRVQGEIYLDVENPNVKIIYPANGTKVNTTKVSVLGIVDDDQTTVIIQANGIEYTNVVVSNRMFTAENIDLIDDAWNPITAIATSPGMKEFVDPVSILCETGTSLPAAPTLNPLVSPTNQNTQTISGTKPADTKLWLNGEEKGFLNSATWSLVKDLQTGGNPLLVYVKDTSNQVSPTVSNFIVYDATAPTRPLVIDDGFITNSKTSLHAKWASDDPETAIADNKYAIGTTPGGEDVAAFTSVGTASEVTVNNLALGQGRTYYFTVVTTNEATTVSEPGYSNGIRVNGSVPKITDVSLADKSKIYQGTSGVNIAVTAQDQDADTLEYQFTIDGSRVQGWSADSDYLWDVPANDFGRKTILVEVRDVQDGQPIGGGAFRNVRVFVVKKPIDAP